MQEQISIFTITLGSAAVIAALAMVYYSSTARSELHRKNKKLHAVITAVYFGLLSIYGTVSGVQVGMAIPNCRNLAALYAGLVAGPIAGIGAGVIGALFRWLVYGGPTGVPCAIVCVLAGVVGSLFHVLLKNKEWRYSIPVGIVASVITEAIHMLFLCLWGFSEAVKVVAVPFLLGDVLGMLFCLYMYKCCAPALRKKEQAEEK